jgi:hypothetical protein
MFPDTSFYITGNVGVDGSVILIAYEIDIVLFVICHYFLHSIVQMNKVWLNTYRYLLVIMLMRAIVMRLPRLPLAGSQ